jgi:hypothetical protein
LDAKWGVNSAALLRKLDALDERQMRALVEAVKGFWQHTDLPTDEALRAAGLLKRGNRDGKTRRKGSRVVRAAERLGRLVDSLRRAGPA